MQVFNSQKRSVGSSFFSKPHIWCFTTYFAEGLPYTIIRMVSPLFLRTMQVSLESIGLTSLFGLPWAVKFLWAPQVDRLGTRRGWMTLMQLLLAILFFAVGLASSLPNGVAFVAALLLAASFFAATNDIAIDGYYIAALDETEQPTYVGYRVMAYRIAMMTGTGFVATIGTTVGWFEAFVAASALMLALFGYHRIFLPRCEQAAPLVKSAAWFVRPGFLLSAAVAISLVTALYLAINSRWYAAAASRVSFIGSMSFSGWVSIFLLAALAIIGFARRRIARWFGRCGGSFYMQAFVSFMDREHIGFIIAFIILLRTGEFLLSGMVAPFMVDLGIKAHYGWMQAAVGLPASIAGAMAGGYLISRLSLQRTLVPFLLAQNCTNLVYMLLAFSLRKFIAVNTGNVLPDPIGAANLAFVAAVQAADQFAGGLGTAVLMTFLMRICKGEFKAAHYAIGSGLMSVSGLFTGVAGGFIAAKTGYGWFFGTSFLLSMPGMLLALPVIKLFPDTVSK